jgi:hypothetical protein
MKKFKVISNNLLNIIVILVGVIYVHNQDKC